MSLSDEHAEFLRDAGISGEMTAGCETTDKGLVFHHAGPTGLVEDQWIPQERFDNLDYDGPKYLMRKGANSPVPVPPGFLDRVLDPAVPLLIVEGSKGHLAAAAAAVDGLKIKTGGTTPTGPVPVAVVGILGCANWQKDGSMTDDFKAIPMRDRDVTIIFDADLHGNRNVWDQAKALSESLLDVRLARSVRFATIPGGGKRSIDDVLADSEAPDLTLARIVDKATDKLGRPPAVRTSASTTLNTALDVANDILDSNHLALGRDGSVYVYRDGKYHNGESRLFNQIVHGYVQYFPDKNFTMFVKDVAGIVADLLKVGGREMPERQTRPLIPFRNGLLDLNTMTLYPHDPDYLTTLQLQVEWDPDAKCPTFDKWAETHVEGLDALLDVVSQAVDPTGNPVKAAMLYGPSRSGKGTFLRIVEALFPSGARAGLSLHQISEDKFLVADLYGKTINISGDLSSRDVRDLSVFKQLLGGDSLQAQRKYGQPFTFRNTATILFSANEVPQVSESSKAYFERIVPVRFPSSYAGKVDPSVERRLQDELPGFVVRLVAALRARLFERDGLFLAQDADLSRDFESASDRVSAFLTEGYEADDKSLVSRKELWMAWKSWVMDEGGHDMTRRKFYERVRNVSWVVEGVRRGVRGFRIRPRTGVARAEGAGFSHPPYTTHSPTSTSDSHSNNDENLHPLHPEPAPPVSETRFRAFDLETGPVEDLHRAVSGRFVTLGAVSAPPEPAPGPAPPMYWDGRDPFPWPDERLSAHNGFNFDYVALSRHHGFDLLAASEAGRLLDTKVLAVLRDPPVGGKKRKAGYYGVNQLSQRLGGVGKTDNIMELAEEYGSLYDIPRDVLKPYLAGDIAAQAVVTPDSISEYEAREMRLMGRLSYAMRVRGWAVDEGLLRERIAEGERVRDGAVRSLVDLGLPGVTAGGGVAKAPQNTAAGKAQIEELLLEAGAVDLPRTKTGALSMSASDWDGYDGPGKEIVDLVLTANGVRTVYQTVSDYLVDGRVFPEVFPSQSSGRLSITKPGLTVFEKRGGRAVERAVFLPDPGEVLLSFDLNQIDARAIAMHSQDPEYMALFQDPSIDSHAEVAKMVFGDASRRNEAKAIGHGWNYGQGVEGLSGSAGVPLEVAVHFDREMRSAFPRLVGWKAEVVEAVRAGRPLSNGFVMPDGSYRLMRPDRERAHTQGPALKGQGLARDLMMEGILRLPLEVAKMLRAVVHDEVVFSVPAGIVEDVKREILSALQFEYLGVPVTAGFEGQGVNWADVYSK